MKPLNRLAGALLARLVAVVPARRRDWVEAALAEAYAVPPGWPRLRWLAGGLALAIRALAIRAPAIRALAIREGAMWRGAGYAVAGAAVLVLPAVNRVLGTITVVLGLVALAWTAIGSLRPPVGDRPGVPAPGSGTARAVALAGVGAAGLVIAYTVVRYPAAVGGRGGPVYLTLVALLLAGYAVAALWMSRQRGYDAALRYGSGFGAAAGVLAATVAVPLGSVVPADNRLVRTGFVLLLAVAVFGAVVAAANRAGRAAGPEQAVAAGVCAGMVLALLVFLAGTAIAVAFPDRLPLDAAVLARHSGTDLIAANLGETDVVYVLFLIAGPVLGALGGAVGAASVLSGRYSGGESGADSVPGR